MQTYFILNRQITRLHIYYAASSESLNRKAQHNEPSYSSLLTEYIKPEIMPSPLKEKGGQGRTL